MDPFVHIKDQIFEMLKNSQLPREQYPGFQAASNYTNIIRQTEYCSNVARWRWGVAEHPWVCPLASLHFCVPPDCTWSSTTLIWYELQISCSNPLQLWLCECMAACAPKSLNKPETGEKRSLCSLLYSRGPGKVLCPESLSGFHWTLAVQPFFFLNQESCYFHSRKFWNFPFFQLE